MQMEHDLNLDCWTVGRKPVQELLFTRPEQVDVVYIQDNIRSQALGRIVDVCKSQKVRFRRVSEQEMRKLHAGNHQGVLARIFQPGFANMGAVLEKAATSPLPLVLALDQIQDPGNLGTLARTVLALGGAGLILPKNRTAFPGVAAAKAGAGALHQLPIAHVTNLARSLDYCEQSGFEIVGAGVLQGSENALTFQPNFPAVLVLGSEDKGIRPNVQKRCARMLHIPMPGPMQSLNVAQAGAIVLGMYARAKAGLK